MNFVERYLKYFLCAINGIFVGLGIILIALGGLILTKSEYYRGLVQDGVYSVPALLLILGCFTTVLFFFGCCGLKKENYCMVMTFAVLLSVILILEVVAGISAYMLRSQSAEIFENTLVSSLEKAYNASNNDSATTELMEAWDKSQAELHCCGVANYTDYKTYNLSKIPESCCMTPNCTTSDPKSIWTAGCGPLIEEKLADAITMAAKWIVAIAVLHLVWIIAACYYATVFRRRETYETV